MSSATSTVLHGGDLVKALKKFSWGDVDGVLLEYDSENVFIPESLIDKLLKYRNDSTKFISHFNAIKYLRELELLNRSKPVQVRDQTFLFSCLSIIRKCDGEFTEKQKKTIEELYIKYSDDLNTLKSKVKEQNDDIPF